MRRYDKRTTAAHVWTGEDDDRLIYVSPSHGQPFALTRRETHALANMLKKALEKSAR